MSHARTFFIGAICFSTGISLAYLFFEYQGNQNSCNVPITDTNDDNHWQDHDPTKLHLVAKLPHNVGKPWDQMQWDHQGENRVAEEMKKKVRILCWVLTNPKNHDTKAKAIKETWGRRCNILLFMSSQADPTLPAIGLNVSGDSRHTLWGKARLAFEYAYDHYKDEADWFIRCDDDSYVIVENLRYFLEPYNTSEPMHFGLIFNTIVKQGYMSGGSGNVLSREAMIRFVEQGVKTKENSRVCRQDEDGADDAELGLCLEAFGVPAVDSRDHLNRNRFFHGPPVDFVNHKPRDPDYWFWKNLKYPIGEGFECCSETAVAFHYVTPDQMYLMEYLIYILKPYGIDNFLPSKNQIRLS